MKFYAAERSNGGYMVGVDEMTWVSENNIKFHSSYHVIGARLLGLTYVDYLHYLESLGGTIRGRQGYAFVSFKDKAAVQKVCDELQKRWNEFEKKAEVEYE